MHCTFFAGRRWSWQRWDINRYLGEEGNMNNAICLIILMGIRQHNMIHLAWDLDQVQYTPTIFISTEVMRMSLMHLMLGK